MIDQNLIAKIQRRQRSRANAIAGDQAQHVVGHRLRALGFRCVERIETGWRVKRVGGKLIVAGAMAKVAADWTAVGADGRSIRCEVKRRLEDSLAWSDLEPHQVVKLNEHAEAGGWSLLAWVSRHGVAIMDWRRVGMKPGASLPWAEAELYDIGRRA